MRTQLLIWYLFASARVSSGLAVIFGFLADITRKLPCYFGHHDLPPYEFTQCRRCTAWRNK